MPALRGDSEPSVPPSVRMGPRHQQHWIISLQHGRNGATLPASSTLLLPKARRYQLSPALAQPSSDMGTPQLKLKLEVLGPCPWP